MNATSTPTTPLTTPTPLHQQIAALAANWSAASSLLRAMVVLFVGTFVGALLLPVGAAGTLPTTWAAWRLPLGVALTSSITAEVAFARKHLSDMAKVLGLTLGAKMLSSLLFMIVLLALVPGCGQPFFPTVDKVEQVVAQDLAEGKSDSQIASDVCAAMGGNSTTDAVCGNVEQVVADTIRVLLTSGVLSQPARERGMGWIGSHPGLCKPVQ